MQLPYTASQLTAVIRAAKEDYGNTRPMGYKVTGENITFNVVCSDSRNHSGLNWYVEFTVNQYCQVTNDGGQYGCNPNEWQEVY